MPSHSRPLVIATIFSIGFSLLIGCAESTIQRTFSASAIGEVPIPVIRQGRYRLVELTPDAAQQDLLQQIIEVSVPPTMDATVGDALRHVLARSGYRLCDAPDATNALYTLPLPAAHLQIGPLTLHDALQLLAGNAWQLSVDDVDRSICFRRRADGVSRNASSYHEPTPVVL